ncbi:15-hydroxyprostaglandin dehydrogenase [NAD(+)] [Aethina tumida]|uniref:15-hydroxyprostaglandin dehydrogenase [NAD(+)] n=1 Tax=Aethina tumida TaxID=116153 RepID=UPI00096AFA6E|nr:15-hydroxyprostaglandin dehydrogenase [NAD(+)] [Aethina tumida]XP_019866921.1 15-hydroxyprostaglandin dehydrogenase [NAD(+)] [Aethina tumida]
MAEFDIKGKIALITGGATGIGLEYSRYLFKHGLKAVTILDLDEKRGNEAVAELGADKALFIKADVTKNDQLESAFQTTVDKWKGLDIVINNAGIMNDQRWELEIAINCNAVAQGTLLGIKHMGKNNGGKGGVIVNIASILGLQELSGCPIYVGTKHFVVGLDRSFGTPYFWNLTGIKFLTMCPGVTATPLISEAGHFALDGYPKLGETLANELGSLPAQKPHNVAEGMITLITKGANGSVWVSEGGEPIYEVSIPNRLTIRKK